MSTSGQFGKTLYPRAASGLRREWSPWVMFYYNLCGSSAFAVSTWLAYLLIPLFPGADAAIASLIAGLLLMPVMLCYAFMASTVPRAGGDYVYMSRILHPVVGFLIVFVGGDLFLMGWIAANFRGFTSIYAPLAFVMLGMPQAASWVASNTFTFIGTILTVLIPALFIAKGMRFLGKAVTIFVAIIVIGHVLVLGGLVAIVLGGGPTYFKSLLDSSLGTGAYQGIIDNANAAGFTPAPFSWTNTIALVGIPFGTMLWGMSVIPHIGEVKGVGRLRNTIRAFIIPNVFQTAVISLIFFLIPRAFGDVWWRSMAWLWLIGKLVWAGHYTPWYISLSALGLGVGLGAVLIFFLITHICQIVFWNINNLANSTKYVFSQSFDRILPSRAAYVSPKSAVPVVALAFFTIGSVIWGAIAVYSPQYTVASMFVSNTFAYLFVLLGTALSAIFLPYRARRAYEQSPLSKYKVAGAPVATVVGIIALIPCVFSILLYALFPSLGAVSLLGVVLLGVLYLAALIYFTIVWFYRKRQGIELSALFKDVPPE